MLKLVKSMNAAIDASIFHNRTHSLLSTESLYIAGGGGTVAIARKIFDKDDYELYPFVFERLIVFFVYHNNYAIYWGDWTLDSGMGKNKEGRRLSSGLENVLT